MDLASGELFIARGQRLSNNSVKPVCGKPETPARSRWGKGERNESKGSGDEELRLHIDPTTYFSLLSSPPCFFFPPLSFVLGVSWVIGMTGGLSDCPESLALKTTLCPAHLKGFPPSSSSTSSSSSSSSLGRNWICRRVSYCESRRRQLWIQGVWHSKEKTLASGWSWAVPCDRPDSLNPPLKS